MQVSEQIQAPAALFQVSTEVTAALSFIATIIMMTSNSTRAVQVVVLAAEVTEM
jgi:hypothetical protein